MSFAGKFAIVSGGAAGIGRELVRQLARGGASVAFCDVRESAAAVKETIELAQKGVTAGAKVSSHFADVTSESDIQRFRSEALAAHGRDAVELLFNNAGIVGNGGSFVKSDRKEWERVFNTDFFGVYYSCRTFLPDLIKAKESRIVNTSSICGFFASATPQLAHTAYCTAKFAVKGLTESLITDLALNAPHVKASVVMPGWIGTDIINIGPEWRETAKVYVEKAPTNPSEAATVILDGVLAGKWRILVGKDAEELDKLVRKKPEEAYTPEFFKETQESFDFYKGLF